MLRHACILLSLTAAFIAGRHALQLARGDAADPYRATEGSARFAALRPYVAGHRLVGYLASRSVGASEADEVAYSQARYTLVPSLLCVHPNQPIVVANLDTDSEIEALLARGGFEVIARPAAGLAVLRRTQR